MKLTRDSAVLTATLLSSVTVFLAGHFNLITAAFPDLGSVWQARIELVSAVSGFVSGLLKMSPLALNANNSMAIEPNRTVNPLRQPAQDESPVMKS